MDALSEMRAVLEEARRHSHKILSAHGHELSRLLQQKELWATIDRGHARSLLTSAAPSSLQTEHQIVMLIQAIEIGATLAAMVLGIVAFGWWGLLFVALVPLYLLAIWQSAQLPRLRSRLPAIGGVVLAVATVYLAFAASTWSLLALTAVLGILSFSSILRYSYPTRVVRAVLVEQPELAGELVDRGVITLHRASELPEIRNRGF